MTEPTIRLDLTPAEATIALAALDAHARRTSALFSGRLTAVRTRLRSALADVAAPLR